MFSAWALLMLAVCSEIAWGLVLFGERLSAWQLFSAALCLAGVAGLKLCPGAQRAKSGRRF